MAADATGLVYDPFGGQNDLQNRVLRCVGVPAERFSEDALRMLRGLRFAARLGLSIEPETASALHACRSLLKNIAEYRRATGATVLMVSHSMDDVARLADRLFVLNHGRLELSGTPAEIFAQAERLRAIGLTVPEVTSLFLRLRELGLPVDPATYTLEDALRQLSALRKGGRPC